MQAKQDAEEDIPLAVLVQPKKKKPKKKKRCYDSDEDELPLSVLAKLLAYRHNTKMRKTKMRKVAKTAAKTVATVEKIEKNDSDSDSDAPIEEIFLEFKTLKQLSAVVAEKTHAS